MWVLNHTHIICDFPCHLHALASSTEGFDLLVTACAPPDLVFENHACHIACFRDVDLFPTEIPNRNARKWRVS